MTELGFAVAGCRVEPFAAEPTLVFTLGVTAPEEVKVDSILLRTQIRIEPERRRYAPEEQERLVELFGTPERWGDTAKPFLWTNISSVVTRFRGSTETELPVPCSYELEVGSVRYFHAVRDGAIPLIFLFSGSVFIRGETGMSVEQLPWDREARFELPAGAWHDVMERYHPGTGWLRLPRATIDRLADHKARQGHATWDAAISSLLDHADRPQPGTESDAVERPYARGGLAG